MHLQYPAYSQGSLREILDLRGGDIAGALDMLARNEAGALPRPDKASAQPLCCSTSLCTAVWLQGPAPSLVACILVSKRLAHIIKRAWLALSIYLAEHTRSGGWLPFKGPAWFA